MNKLHDTQARAARLTALEAEREIDPYWVFSKQWRDLAHDLSAHVETLTQQVADLTKLADLRLDINKTLTRQHNEWKAQAERAEQKNARLTAENKRLMIANPDGALCLLSDYKEQRTRAEQAEQQRDAAHAALREIRALAHDCHEHDARLTLDEMQHQIDAALAASAPQKGEA